MQFGANMTEIPLTDQYLESMTRNADLVRDYGFVKDAGDNLRGIDRRGCSCNWSGKVRTVLEQMRNSFIALPAEEVTKLKKALGVEGRNFIAFRKTANGSEKKII
jgi:hypothetical protein